MTGPRLAWLACGISCLLGACSDGASGGASPDAAAQGPELGPLISGTSSYVGGTFVWTDYVYDDQGASTDGRPGGNGEGGYPPGLENSADFVQLQIGLGEGALEVTAILQTLNDRHVPVLGVAFDTDADAATGAAHLPGGAWSPAAPLGVDVLLVVRGGGAELLRHADGVWRQVAEFPATVDEARNLLAVRIPPDILHPGSATWRAFAVLGYAAPDSGASWPEGGAIMDIAFVRDEPPYLLQTVKQADVLAGLRDPDIAAATIDFGRVAAGHTELARPRPGRFETFLHRSRLDLPGGIRQASGLITGQEYLGPYQPYLVWVPDPLPDPAPLHVFLHGASQNHLLDTWLFLDSWPYHGLSPRLIGGYAGNNKPAGVGEDIVYMPNDGVLGTVLPVGGGFVPYDAPGLVMFPLGRMNSSSYQGIYQHDVMEALADIQRRLHVDPDRISLSGSSMGGIGSFRLAALYPDVWSHVFPIIGHGEDVEDLLGNLRNIPVRMQNGLLDPLIAQPDPSRTAARLHGLGIDYRYWLFELREHESLFEINHCVRNEAFAAVRDRNPARVTYTVRPDMFQQDAESGLDLRYDSAYWVSGIRVREGSERGQVDATNLSRPDREPVTRPLLAQRLNVLAGRDVCGPNAEARTLDTWTETGLVHEAGEAQPVSNGVALSLEGVTELTLDIGLMGLSVDDALEIDADSDGEAELTLTGAWQRTVELWRDDARLDSLAPIDGGVVVPVASGRHRYSIR